MENNGTNKGRIVYIDYLKSLAMFAVILMHISILMPHIKFLNCSLGDIFEFCRFAVPLFLTITGALLLNREYKTKLGSFFIKRSSKLVLPYLLWIFIVFLLVLHYSPLNFVGFEIIKLFCNLFFDFGILWYFWLILGVYLVIPIVNDFILKRGMDGAKYFLLICVFASIFYQICNIFNTYSFFDLRFFVGPVLFIVLGYYLRFNDFKLSDNKMIILALVLFIITSIIKVRFNVIPGNISFFYGLNNHSFTQGENIFLDTFLDVGIVEIIHVASIFLLFRFIANKTGIIKKILFNNVFVRFFKSTSRATWGMYLAHASFLIMVPPYISKLKLTGTEGVIVVILVSIFVFFITWIITLLLHKIPYIRKFSGYY